MSHGNFKELLFYISFLDIKSRYRGTILGFAWSIIEPLAQLGVLFAVFSFIHSFETSFLIYLFSGLIMVHFFSRSTNQAMNSLIAKKNILFSLQVPKIIFPLSNIMSNFWMFGIELLILFSFMIIFNLSFPVTTLLLIIIFVLLLGLSIGMALLLSILRIYLKDIQSIWGIVSMSLIFITPVFWFVKDMPKFLAELFLLNPLALLMELTHKVLLFGEIPNFYELSYSFATVFGILFLGYFLFKKTERRVVENL